VRFEVLDPSGGQLGPESTANDLDRLDMSLVPPLCGPVWVEGAEPCDALRVDILDVRIADWGWTAILPGFGLLADEFPEPALRIWALDPQELRPAQFAPGVRVPLKPFAGVMGVAPVEEGQHSSVVPRRVGGNIDTRDLSAGAALFLPVEVPGALFSCGDGHAAQGDGEVCGTAIETAVTLTLRLDLVKAAALPGPRFIAPRPVTGHVDGKGYDVTMGVSPDLMEAARSATRDMVDLLCASRSLSRVDAYMLCSTCGDLRLSEVVDRPNWVVSMYLPRILFDQAEWPASAQP
jgi:acetamidase/formamidase